MPRGKKQKVIVIRCPITGKIIKHRYHYNHRNTEKASVVGSTYNPTTKKHHKGDEFKVKDEKHSS